MVVSVFRGQEGGQSGRSPEDKQERVLGLTEEGSGQVV